MSENRYSTEINQIVNMIYEGSIESANASIMTLIEKISVDNHDSNEFQNILKYLLIAMENHDYQLVSDVLFYEMNAFLGRGDHI